MLPAFFSPVVALWKMWAAMFVSLPNGDPFIAVLALVLILAITMKAVQILRRQLASNTFSAEEKRLELYRRVMNIS